MCTFGDAYINLTPAHLLNPTKYRTLGHVLSNNGQCLRAAVQYVLLFYLCSFKIYRVTCSYSDAHSYTLLIVGIKMCYLFHSCWDPKRTDPGTWATGSNWKRHCQRTSRVISTSHVCMLQNSCIPVTLFSNWTIHTSSIWTSCNDPSFAAVCCVR